MTTNFDSVQTLETSYVCNKYSKSVSYETLVGGTTTIGTEIKQKESSLILRKAKFQAIFKFVLSSASGGAGGGKYNRISAFVSMPVLLIRSSLEKFFKKNFRDDFYFFVASPKDSLHRHPERSEGSIMNNIKYWILRFANASLRMTMKRRLRMTIPTLTFLLSLNLSESWAVTCNFTPDPNNAGKYSLEVKGDSGENVFSGCDNGFPDGISEWSQVSSKITSATLDKNITSIGRDAFNGASSLTSITIPNSVTSIERSAFNGASSLTSITIPDSVTSIGAGAFRNASSLESITIPDSVTYVGGDAFLSVKEIIISDKLDMSGWDSDALLDDGDGTVTFKCKGNQDVCRVKIEEFAARAIYISGNNIIFDAGDHRECFRTPSDDENVSYYHTGTECAELPESGNITCASGYADYNGNCYAQLPFSKKRWTPAEANQWLHDGNDNFVVITFKK